MEHITGVNACNAEESRSHTIKIQKKLPAVHFATPSSVSAHFSTLPTADKRVS